MIEQPTEPVLTEPLVVSAVPESVSEEPEPDDSISAVFARLYEDGRSYAEAELDRQKLRASIIGAGVRDAAIFAMVAVMLVFAVLVALLIGLIIALAPALTALGATAAVLSSALLVAVLLLLAAKARIRRMKRAIKG